MNCYLNPKRRERKLSVLSRLSPERKNEILGLLLLALAILTFLSLLSYERGDFENWGGVVGGELSYYLILALGYPAFLLPLLLGLWGLNRLLNAGAGFPRRATLLLSITGVLFSCFVHLPGLLSSEELRFKLGGLLGRFLSAELVKYFGDSGSYVITLTLFLVTLIFTTQLKIIPLLSWIVTKPFFSLEGLRERRGRRKERRAARALRKRELNGKKKQPEIKPSLHRRRGIERKSGEEIQTTLPLEGSGYRYPPLDLLKDPPPSIMEKEIKEELSQNAALLAKKLSDFEIEGEVVGVSQGPVITSYEFRPAPGVKVNRITALSDDLALGLKASRIRVVAPIPGRDVVGIEVPNRKIQLVYLKEIISSDAFRKAKSKLTLALGKTAEGNPFCTDLSLMPHLLIAGATGSGKSVCINCIICGILFRADPSEVNFLMIDPKRLELTGYNGIPHMCAGYEKAIIDPKGAVRILRVALSEMEERYKRFAHWGVRDIVTYNQKLKGMGERVLPQLIIIIDELADLIMNPKVSNEVELSLTRLAQMARAVGIHLILATQRPSVDVITGIIKANFPVRIGFQVASKVDSRTILDINGAEKLLGKGDMLFLPAGRSGPLRLHGSYITASEIEGIVKFVKDQELSYERYRLAEKGEDVGREGEEEGETDDLFEEAKRLVIIHKQGSVSLLQRRLGIGYARAGRLIDQLERAGIVGPYEGSKSREVLADESFLEGG